MTPPVPESDLLALVEGTLTPEREAEVRAALRRDPETSRLVDALASDRQLIRVIDAPSAAAAPSGLVSAAMAEAGRRASEPPPESLPFPGSRVRRWVGIGIAACVVVSVGTWTLLPRLTSRTEQFTGTGPTAGEGFRFHHIPSPDDDGAAVAELPEMLRPQGTTAELMASRPAQTPRAESQGSITEETRQRMAALRDRMSGPSSREQARRDEQLLRALTDTNDRALLDLFEYGGMPLSRAADLASTSRLKIVIVANDPGAISRRTGFTVVRPVDSGDSIIEALPDSREAVDLSFVPRPDASGLETALAGLVDSIQADGMASVRFEELGEADDPSLFFGRVIPSGEIGDVLWWENPATLWLPRASILIPVEVVMPEEPAP